MSLIQKLILTNDTIWFSGTGAIQTYKLEELLGTKLRALYQRKKGKDLYDLYKAIFVSKQIPVKYCPAMHLTWNLAK
jgi:predicted nucleotidyltransferase component of viral defense system